MFMAATPPWLQQWFLDNPGYHRTIDGLSKLVCPRSNHHQFFYVKLDGWNPARKHKCPNCGRIVKDPVPIVGGERKLREDNGS